MTPAWVTDTVTTDLRRAARYTLLWGLEGVVLRTVGGRGDRVPFVNEAAVRARLDEAELPVVAVDPGLFEGAAGARAAWMNDLDALDDTLRFCGRLGCPLVRVGALAAEEGGGDGAVDALRRAGDRAARVGVRLAVRNGSETAVATGADLARLLAAVDHPAVGADWRPLDAVRSGEAADGGLTALLDAPHGIASVAVADASADGTPVAPGGGVVGWEAHLQRLAEAAFDGPLALEVEGRPVGTFGLEASTALVRLTRASRRGR